MTERQGSDGLVPDATADTPTDRLAVGLLLAGIALLLVVGASGESVASPPLGLDGWAPGSLPWTPGAWTIVALQVGGYLLGAASLLRHLHRPTPLRVAWWHLGLLAVLILFTSPFGTADHTNYAAYGHILATGGDPWAISPQDFGGVVDPVTQLVQPPWQDTPSVYGPIGTWLMGLAGLVGGDLMRQIVWVWQVLIVLAWLGMRELLVAAGSTRSAVDRWWTLNILVIGSAVLGAHLDTFALLAMFAALLLGLHSRPWLAGAMTGVAASIKVTAGVVALALILGWLGRDAIRSGWVQRLRGRLGSILAVAIGTLAVMVPLHLLASPETIAQVRSSGDGLSYAMPWRVGYMGLGQVMSESSARSTIVVIATAFCVVLAVALWRLTSELDRWPEVRALAVLTTAYSLGASYILPWYELMQWGSIALLAGLCAVAGHRLGRPLRLLLWLLVIRGTVLTIAYAPGRVVMPPDVADVTLGFRFVAAPLTTFTLWVVIAVMVWRARDPEIRRAGLQRA